MSAFNNKAEASSSSRHMDQVTSIPLATRPRAPSTVSAAASATASNGRRKVRTVPPSAVLQPPTPPAESQPTFDTAIIPPAEQKKHQKPRYFSSDESSGSSSADESDDDEPPWWTFTQRGVVKLRNNMTKADRAGVRTSLSAEQDSTAAEGDNLESTRDYWRLRTKKNRKVGTPPRENSGASTPSALNSAAARLFHPRPFRNGTGPSSLVGPRQSGSGDNSLQMTTSGGAAASMGSQLKRSNSAPMPPVQDADSPTTSTRVMLGTPTAPRFDSPEPTVQSDREVGDANSSPTRLRHRQRPTARRLLSLQSSRRSTEGGVGDSLTDSETAMHTSPRFKATQRMFRPSSLVGTPLSEEPNGIELADTPTNKYRRRNAPNLRIRLPPPISEHFANGNWSHAGTWQDALRYGYDEPGQVPIAPRTAHPDRHLDRLIDKHAHTDTEANDAHAAGSRKGGSGTDPESGTRTPKMEQRHRPVFSRHSSSDTGYVERTIQPERRRRRSRRKSKRERFRPAEVPPTPGGALGLRELPEIHDWGNNRLPTPDPSNNPFDRVNPFDRIDEENSLSHVQTRSSGKVTQRFRLFSCLPPRRRSPTIIDDLDWPSRFRRMIFLDARVTIYLRLLNLGIAVVLLALAITIRLRLEQLGTPGVVGPSTTLILSYACLTIVHVLTAMYREWYGRPIGLWGLRSKMLWVCLDLFFIALWSSAATLAINDYIDTPLDCTPFAPWWSHLDYYIATPEATTFANSALVPERIKSSSLTADVCRRQVGCFTISLIALLLYICNMVLSLFRIFETVRRTAGSQRPLSV